MANNLAYPGNPSLPREAREKVLSTFRHTLNLFKGGKREDCAIGCDFILKMDPRFTPARQLLEMARNPNPSAPVNVADLEKYVLDTPTPQERVAAASPEKLMIEAIEAYAARDFGRAIENANRVLSAIPGNADALEILGKAKKKLDLQPHVENFRQRALFALESGQIEEAKLNFERMRNLDPEHPELDSLAQRLQSEQARRAGPAPPPPPPPAGPPPAAPRPAGAPVAPPPPNFFNAPPKNDLDIDFDLAEPPPAASVPPRAAPRPPVTPSPPADLRVGSTGFESSATPPSPSVPPGVAPAPGVPPPPAFFDAPPPAPDLWSSPASAPGAPAPSPGTAPPAGHPVPPEIERLLREGDDLEARGNPQSAIEAWSRIFLIDLNNSEAAARIERTRARLADANRRVSEALRGGRSLYEAGKLKEAREKFLEVLAIDENEPTARSYLNRIEEDLARPQPSYDLSQRAGESDVLAEDELPAEQAAASGSAREKAERPPSPAAKKSVALLLVAGVLLLAIVAGIFLLFRSRTRVPPPAAVAGTSAGSIAEAQRLFKEGKVDDAREILQKIPNGDPQFPRAQKLLATIASPATATATPSTASTTAAAPVDAAAQRADAEASLGQHRYIDALKSFNLSAAAYPNDDTFKQEMNQAAEKVQEISSAVKLYNDGDYDAAIPILWRMYLADHGNLDVRSYLVRSYYNQGVNALQNNLFDKASQAFKDALGVEPGDELCQRQKAFSDRYLKHSPDLLARIYVKYLRPRP